MFGRIKSTIAKLSSKKKGVPPAPGTPDQKTRNSISSTPDQKVRKALYMVLDRLDDHLKDELHELIDGAPAPVIGRNPTEEEIQTQDEFKTKAKNFLNSCPPESGITYQAVMQQVEDELAKRKKKLRPSKINGGSVAASNTTEPPPKPPKNLKGDNASAATKAEPQPKAPKKLNGKKVDSAPIVDPSPTPASPLKSPKKRLVSPAGKSPRRVSSPDNKSPLPLVSPKPPKSSRASLPSIPPVSPRQKSPARNSRVKKRRSSRTKKKDPTRLVEYLCVLDFMATCNEGPPPKPQEIIEFPAMLVNAETGEVEGKFHCHVKPDVHPKLSDYCIDLTGITQDQVDGGIRLLDALEMHQDWLSDHDLISLTEALEQGDKKDNSKRTFLYAICGDWDLKVCLPNQLEHQKEKVPAAFLSWINVKWPFENMHHKKVRGIADMLNEMGLPPDSSTESGLDDCRNLATICQKMIKHGWTPNPTAGEGRTGTKPFWEVQRLRPWPPQSDPVSPYKMIYLIRSAQSEAEVVEGKDRSTNSDLKDCGLTELGIQESKDLSKLLEGGHLKDIELVVTSPLKRALHTSLSGFPEHNIIVNYDLAEVGRESPENSPKPMEDVLAELEDHIKHRKEGVTLDHKSLKPKKWPRPPGNEPPIRRIQSAFQSIYMDCNEQTIAVVCHSHVIRTAIYGASAPVAPDNAVPIKCQLFMSGNLVPV